jgi:RimJ/RimL family protein N-acetyltransferase
LFAAAGDPANRAQHPASSRHGAEAFNRCFDVLLSAGGTLAAVETQTGGIIGWSRFHPVPDHRGEIGIGVTFLSRSHWGGGWNREMKHLMVADALRHFPRIRVHIAPRNLQSQIATTRLGAQCAYDADPALTGAAAATECYTMTARDWTAATGIALAE